MIRMLGVIDYYTCGQGGIKLINDTIFKLYLKVFNDGDIAYIFNLFL